MIMDRTIPYTWRTENQSACYHEMFLQDKDILFTKVAVFPFGDDDAALPIWQKRTVDTNKCLSTYSIYKRTIRNGKFKSSIAFFDHTYFLLQCKFLAEIIRHIIILCNFSL